jgi:A/G-specific adenine glycosylase
LPWRQTRDPYAIWLSEIILQQTRIQQGWAYWERFVHRWPTVVALAGATEDEVLREWQGLGYYSRARNLHFAARQIVARGGFPETLEEIKQLKGVGDYTAAAIASIAFDIPAAVVDGNVYRVLSRYFGISTPINATEGKKEFTTLAQSLLPPKEASAFNQAMMDFGAIQCTPQSPRCLLCPLQESCVAFRENKIGELPVKMKTLKVKERHLTYIYIRCNGETAIHRRGEGDIWQGLWEPLLIENGEWRMENYLAQPNSQFSILHSQLLRKAVKHVLTHRVIYADFWLWETKEKPSVPDGYIWIKESDICNYGVPRLVEILLESLPR